MFKVAVTLNAPNPKAADWAYQHACIYPSGRKNQYSTRTRRVTMVIDWVMESPTNEDEARDTLMEHLLIDRCEELGVDIEAIEISEGDY